MLQLEMEFQRVKFREKRRFQNEETKTSNYAGTKSNNLARAVRKRTKHQSVIRAIRNKPKFDLPPEETAV